MAVYLIRHGQSEGNIDLPTPNDSQIPLTALGQQQARGLADKLPKADRIIVSPYLRARQTATPVIARDGVEPEVWPVQEFGYLDPLECRNTTRTERKPMVNAYWQRMDPQYQVAPSAESFAQVYERAMATLAQLKALHAQQPDETIVVFSHGLFLQLLRLLNDKPQPLSEQLMREFLQREQTMPIRNAQVVELLLDKGQSAQ